MKTKTRPRPTLRRTLEVSGRVVGQEDGDWIVRAGSRRLRARRAASCLLAPRTDDEVTVVLLEDGRAFVTAVLERPEAGTSHLVVPGDAVLCAGGTLTFSAREAHTFAERVVTCAATRTSSIEGADHVEAGALDLVARGGARLHARETLLTADAVVKIDSDQVHVG